MDASSRTAAALLVLLYAVPAAAETPSDEEVGIPDVADAVDGEVIDDVVDGEVVTDVVSEGVGADVDSTDGSASTPDAEADVTDPPDGVDTDAVADTDPGTDTALDAVDDDASGPNDATTDAAVDAQLDAEPDTAPDDVTASEDGSIDDTGSDADAAPDDTTEPVAGSLEFRTSVQLRGGPRDESATVTVTVGEPAVAQAQGVAGEIITVPDLSAGDYDVLWEGSGYEPAQAVVTLPSDGVFSVILYPAGEFDLRGTVTVAGSPVGGATLTLTGLSAALTGLEPLVSVSDEAGAFEFVGAAAGLYRLDARSGEFAATLAELELLQDTTVNLRLVDETAFPPVETDSGCAAAAADSHAPPVPTIGLLAMFWLGLRRRRRRV